MAGLAAYGTTITFHTSYFSGKIKTSNLDGYNREKLDTTHMTSTNGWATYIPSKIQEPGQIKVNILYDPDTAPPIDQAAEAITFTFPVPTGKTVGASMASSGFLTEFSFTGEVRGLYMADATLVLSGEPTWTASS